MNTFFRPEWTCGRYNKKAQVAIMYNLIEGMCYFFEDYSAIVIAEILSISRNNSITSKRIAEKTGIATESIEEFATELHKLGLITSEKPTKIGISEYRKEVGKFRKTQTFEIEKTVQEKLPYDIAGAELSYSEAMEKYGVITSLMFELTYNCSEQCIHCYNPGAARNSTDKNTRARKEIDLDDYKRVIDDLDEHGLVKVCLSGGDPFSKPIIWEIIDYLHHKEIAFDLFTNAQLLDVDRLLNYYPRLIGVSIYSMIPKVHDAITQRKGSLEKSVLVVEQLSEYGIPMNIKCPIMITNVKSYRTVAEFSKKVGAIPQFELSLTDSNDGDTYVSKNLRLPPELLEIVLQDSDIPLYVGKEAPNFGGQNKLLTDNACGAGISSLCITPEGNVQSCCAFPLSFGNVKEQRISTIINESKELEYWRNLTLEEYDDCGKLEYCAYCNLCPGVNYVQHGSALKAGESNCYMAKTRHQLANKMINGSLALTENQIQYTLNNSF